MMEVGRKRLVGILIVMLIYLVVLLVVLLFSAPPQEPESSEPSQTLEEPAQVDKETPSREKPLVLQAATEEFEEIPDPIPSLIPEIEDTSESLPVEEEIIAADYESVPIIEEPTPIVEASSESSPFDEFVVSEEIEEDDPWADFYVAGEEDYSIFDDGDYYVPLIVNAEYLNDITVTFLDDAIFVNVAEFRQLISELLIDSYEQELFNTQEQSFSLDFLNEQEIETWYDYQTFELHMSFPTWMMPTRVLSINRGGVARYSSYSMSGSTFLEPEPFSWFANISLYSMLDVSESRQWEINPTSLFTMQSRNSLALFDVGFDFSYTVHPGRAYNTLTGIWSQDYTDYFTFQGIQGFYDYKPKSLRFFFGNVNDYLGYSLDTIGIGVEKRYAYGDAKPKNHQYEAEVVLEEPSLVEVFINEKSVYRRELQAGVYKLRDFAFAQGANMARIVVESIADPTKRYEQEFVVGFDSRLLAKGDTLYSASISFPNYDINNTVARINQQFGFTDEITSQYSLAFSTSAITLGLSNIIATPFGSFDFLVSASYNTPLSLGLSGMLSYRISGKEDSSFGALSISGGFSTNRYTSSLSVPSGVSPSSGHNFDGSISYSGRIGDRLSYSLGGSLNWTTSDTLPSWRISLSTGIPLIPRMSVNGSINVNASPIAPTPELRGQVGLNYAFSPDLSVSASSNIEESSYVSASWRPFGSTTNSMQFSFSGISFTDPLNHQGSVSYSRSGTRYGLSLRQQYSDNFSRFVTSLSFNTAFAYAGGLLGMTRSVPDNFLLVKAGGAMKGSDIAVTRTMTSEPTALPSLFGVGAYTGITTHQQNNVVVYGVGESLMGSSESFIYDFLPRPRQGYAVRISGELTYSLVGTLLRTPNSAYSRYTTDLARVERDEEGNETLVLDETLYLFTDENGFFYSSGLTVGEYQFSLFLPESTEEDPPIDIRFTIKQEEEIETPQVLVLQTFVASEVSAAIDYELYESLMGNEIEESIFDAEGFYRLDIMERMDETEFWDSYYPSRQVLDSITVSPEAYTTDSIVEFIDPSSSRDSALSRMRREHELQLFNLARLRAVVLPYLDAITPKPDWNIDTLLK